MTAFLKVRMALIIIIATALTIVIEILPAPIDNRVPDSTDGSHQNHSNNSNHSYIEIKEYA